ncbi:MAG: hypothetical protein DRR19_29150 [Candidatus Parabeggiatoa sp. nov. 1]|nr:MAG: hypothetical protein DRR19_29150 [Gammaproteobacteria bacterium]
MAAALLAGALSMVGIYSFILIRKSLCTTEYLISVILTKVFGVGLLLLTRGVAPGYNNAHRRG